MAESEATPTTKRSTVLIVYLAELMDTILHKRKGSPGLTILEQQLYGVWGKELIRLFAHDNSLWKKKWSGFFTYNNVKATTYTTAALAKPNATYLRISRLHTKAYVGATRPGVLAREAARRRAPSPASAAPIRRRGRWWPPPAWSPRVRVSE